MNTSMNKKRFGLMLLTGFVFVFIYEMLVHGFLLMGMYEQTMNLWRPEDEMNMPFMTGMQFVFVVIMAFIFTRHYENKGPMEGVRFGFYLGLLMAFAMLSFYAFMPIPFMLAAGWFITTLVEIVLLGLIFAMIYKAA